MMSRLLCGGVTFENAPVELRERVAFRPEILAEALHRIRRELQLDEAVILSTCNRVEFFAATDRPDLAVQAWPRFLRDFHRLEPDFSIGSFAFEGAACAEHLFQVAAGLKSMVVGETEIFGQVKDAYETAVRLGTTGKWTNRLFQSSFAAAKDVRTRTMITRGCVSVGSVAVELAEKIFGGLAGRAVMVIGAGDTSEKTARSLQSRGVRSIIVANRTFDRAAELARELGGQAVRWEQWESAAHAVDIMISSTSAPHYVLTREQVEALQRVRQGRPLFLIDLAVPRDLEPAINALDDVFLYDIDDLQSIAGRHLRGRQAEVERGNEILRAHLARFCAWAEVQAPRHEGTHPFRRTRAELPQGEETAWSSGQGARPANDAGGA